MLGNERNNRAEDEYSGDKNAQVDELRATRKYNVKNEIIRDNIDVTSIVDKIRKYRLW